MTTAGVTQHAIHDIVQRLLDLEGDPALYSPEVSADEVTAYARDKTFVAAKLIKSYLAQIDPLAVSVWGLSQMQAAIQSIFNELTAFISTRNSGHLHNSGSQVDQQLYPLMWVFATRTQDDSSRPTEIVVGELREGAALTFQQLVIQRDKLTAELAVLTEQINAQSTRLETMTTTIATQKADAATVTAVVQQTYAKEATERSTAFNSNEQAMRDQFDELRRDMTGKATDALTSLEKSKNDAAKLVGVVGNIGVTGNYQEIANKENRAASTWRIMTLIFFGFAIALAVATFVEFWKEPVTAPNAWAIAIRLLYAIALAAPAWYTAKESARHRTNSDRARQRELELASLGPFIELLPQPKKEEIREHMTKLYFGKEVEEHHNSPAIDSKDLKDVILELIKVIKK